MQVIYRDHASTHKRLHLPRAKSETIDVVHNFQHCLETYVKDRVLIKARKEVKHKAGLWLTRPLGKSYLRYAAADVKGILQLYQELRENVEKKNAIEQLLDYSNRYVDFYRSQKRRIYDDEERKPILPSLSGFQCTDNEEVK